MATSTEYRVGGTDAAKVKRYDHRMFIAQAEFDKDKKFFQDWWNRYENHPRRRQVTGKGHRVNVPTGVAVIDSLFSMMTAVNIDTILTPEGATTRQQAELASAALTHEWELLHVQSEGNAAVKDASVVGIGWVKVGYEYAAQVSTDPRPVEDIRNDILEMLRQASEARTAGVEGVPEYDDIVGNVPIEEEVEHVLRDRIVVDYVPWDRILVDSTAKRIEDVKWVAQATPMRVEDVRDNASFKAYVKRTRGGLARLKDIKGESTFENDMLPAGKVTDDDLFVTVYEFWDLDAGTVCTFIKGQDWLLNESANPFALNLDYKSRNPFVPCVLRKTATRLRGISDMELIAPSLDEQDVYRSATATFVERFVPKVLAEEDAITPEGKVALGSPEYGAIVSYATGKEKPEAMNPPVLPAEVFDMDGRITETIRDAVGSNELTRGQFAERTPSATETSEVVAASNARHAERRNTLEVFWSDIAERVLQLMQLFYDQPRMTRYVDPSYGAVEWKWAAEDIQMEYGLSISLTPKEEPTAQSKKDNSLAIFNFLIPLSEPGPDGSSVVDKAKLIQWMASEFGMSKADQLDILNLPEEQQAQQLAAQQNVAAMGAAASGAPDPGLTTGPLGPEEVAALTNQGQVPDQLLQASGAPGAVGSAGAVEAVNESTNPPISPKYPAP